MCLSGSLAYLVAGRSDNPGVTSSTSNFNLLFSSWRQWFFSTVASRKAWHCLIVHCCCCLRVFHFWCCCCASADLLQLPLLLETRPISQDVFRWEWWTGDSATSPHLLLWEAPPTGRLQGEVLPIGAGCTSCVADGAVGAAEPVLAPHCIQLTHSCEVSGIADSPRDSTTSPYLLPLEAPPAAEHLTLAWKKRRRGGGVGGAERGVSESPGRYAFILDSVK